MELIYKKQYRLTNPESDLTMSWRPSAMFLEMQNAGEEHSQLLGVGYDALLAHNLAWVITRSMVRMERYPRRNELMTITTWPGKPRHGLFPRYYTFTDADGNELGKASTMWVVMNLATRAMVSPKEYALLDFEVPDIPGCLPLPGNVAPIDAEPLVYERTPTYTDIDVNGHMNNTRYIDWLCETYAPDWHSTHSLNSLIVHYDSELLPGSVARIELRREGTRFNMRGTENETVHFAISGEWSARETKK